MEKHWPLLCGFIMVMDNSVFDPMQTILEEADSLKVSRKQVKARDWKFFFDDTDQMIFE